MSGGPMYLLPLDQRMPWPTRVLATAKRAIYDGFREAAEGTMVEAGVIADDSSGAAILRDAAARGFAAACAIGAIDDPAADIDDAVAHARACGAVDWTALLQYNPDADCRCLASPAWCSVEWRSGSRRPSG